MCGVVEDIRNLWHLIHGKIGNPFLIHMQDLRTSNLEKLVGKCTTSSLFNYLSISKSCNNVKQ